MVHFCFENATLQLSSGKREQKCYFNTNKMPHIFSDQVPFEHFVYIFSSSLHIFLIRVFCDIVFLDFFFFVKGGEICRLWKLLWQSHLGMEVMGQMMKTVLTEVKSIPLEHLCGCHTHIQKSHISLYMLTLVKSILCTVKNNQRNILNDF